MHVVFMCSSMISLYVCDVCMCVCMYVLDVRYVCMCDMLRMKVMVLMYVVLCMICCVNYGVVCVQVLLCFVCLYALQMLCIPVGHV